MYKSFPGWPTRESVMAYHWTMAHRLKTTALILRNQSLRLKARQQLGWSWQFAHDWADGEDTVDITSTFPSQ